MLVRLLDTVIIVRVAAHYIVYETNGVPAAGPRLLR